MDFNPWLLVLCLVVFAYFIYRSMTDLYTTLDRLGIPGPRPVWVFGNVLEFKDRDVLSVFKEWKAKFGKVYGFYEGFRPGIVVNDPEIAKEILQTRFGLFHCRMSYRPFQYYPTGLQVVHETDFETWKGNRGVVDKVLNFTGNMKQVMDGLQSTSKSMMQGIELILKTASEGFDITDTTHRFTSETIMKLLLNFDADDIQKYQATIYEYERQSTYAASTENEISGLARLFPSLTPILKLADGAHKKSHESILSLLRGFLKRKIGDQNNNKTKPEDNSCILSKLLSTKILTRDIDGSMTRRPLADDEIISHLLLFLSETYHTTASMIQFMLYELARNPECQEKLYEEIIDICGPDGLLDQYDLKDLHYFDMACNESYRLHPIAPGVTREAAFDCTVKGHRILEGMPVRIMTCTMYNDESIFPDPETFKPERFSAENQKARHQFSFLPFGMGPRMCPGVKLANVIVKSAIVTILRHYRLETSHQTQIPLKHAFRPSLCPANGVHVVLTARQS